MQLQHSEGVESGEKRDAYKESLAKSYIANGRAADALGLLRELPQNTERDPRILCLIADAQVALASICAGFHVQPIGGSCPDALEWLGTSPARHFCRQRCRRRTEKGCRRRLRSCSDRHQATLRTQSTMPSTQGACGRLAEQQGTCCPLHVPWRQFIVGFD